MNNIMEVKFSAKSENESLARVIVASFAAKLDPTLDELADIKTAVSEAVTNSIIHGYDEDDSKFVYLRCEINENTINSKTPYIKIASDLVEFDEQYRDIIENILGRTIVIDNIDNGIKFANETNHKFKVVTLDGDILNPGGSLTGGSQIKSNNTISIKYEIEELRRKSSFFEEKNKNILKDLVPYLMLLVIVSVIYYIIK